MTIPGIMPAKNSEPMETDPTTPNMTKGMLGGMMTPIDPAAAVSAEAKSPG